MDAGTVCIIADVHEQESGEGAGVGRSERLTDTFSLRWTSSS
jgi:hypothetical protein